MDSQQTRIRIKTLNETITRNKIIELTFVQAGVPFIRVFGEYPAFTAICRTTEANTLLKTEMKNKLRKHGLEVQIPQEVRAKRTVFLRQLDRSVGAHSAEEIKEEVQDKNEWAGNVKRKWWVLALPPNSPHGNGRQSPKVEPFKQGDRPPNAEKNSGRWYSQRLGGQARLWAYSRYIHVKQK